MLVSENAVKHLKVSNCRYCVLNVVYLSNNLGILSEAFIMNHSLFKKKLYTFLKVLLTYIMSSCYKTTFFIFVYHKRISVYTQHIIHK